MIVIWENKWPLLWCSNCTLQYNSGAINLIKAPFKLAQMLFSGEESIRPQHLMSMHRVSGDKTSYLTELNQSPHWTARPSWPGTKSCYLIVLTLFACTGLFSGVNLPDRLTALRLLTARINHHAHFLLSPRQHFLFFFPEPHRTFAQRTVWSAKVHQAGYLCRVAHVCHHRLLSVVRRWICRGQRTSLNVNWRHHRIHQILVFNSSRWFLFTRAGCSDALGS